VVKAEWGTKRICQSCATKFYDLRRQPIACPECGKTFDPEALLKSRRSRPALAKRAAPAKQPAVATGGENDKALGGDPDTDLGKEGGDLAEGADANDDDDSVVKNAPELGGDDEDIAEVVVTRDSKED
jgi:uncharacterized protein (TIGR02300 family)